MNCLLALDGLYGEIGSNQPNLARRLFDVYRESVIFVDTGRIPGLAFKNNIPYMELKLHDFQRLVSSEVQLQFYQEAGIKTVVLLGCSAGEIELGMATDPPADLEKEMNNLISLQAATAIANHPPSSSPSPSSSSLHSLSESTSEYLPLVFNSTPSSSFVPKQPHVGDQDDQAKQLALNQIRSNQLPTIESEDAAMTKAILAVLSASPSQSSSSLLPPCNVDQSRSPTAFTRYKATSSTTPPGSAISLHETQNKFKRAVLFFRNLNWRRTQELQGNRPSVAQLHHMISERRRREKLNESFNLLKSLLPPGTKKDKASVLSSTTEHMSWLKSQVAELMKKNQMLESQLSARKSETRILDSSERVNVEITQVSSSTSEARYLDLRVSLRGESSILDLLTRLLEFLKKQQQRNLSLLSLESSISMSESVPVHGVMLRLKIEGGEFDNSGFEEGVRRVADDQTH